MGNDAGGDGTGNGVDQAEGKSDSISTALIKARAYARIRLVSLYTTITRHPMLEPGTAVLI